MISPLRIIYVVLLICLTPQVSIADLLAPLGGGNRSPLVAIYGLPTRTNTETPLPGQWRLTLDNSLASNYLNTQRSSNALLLDGETWRTEFRFDCALSNNLSFAATIPYVAHSGGFLDSFIEDWHRTFGLPQGGRDDAPRNRILYRYQENGTDRVLLDKSARGLGDLRLAASWSQSSTKTTRFHLSLKLPTGDPDRLLGSGAPDLNLWLTRSARFDTKSGRFGLSGSIGGSWLGRGDVLPSRQRRNVIFGRLSGGWQPYSWLAAQLLLEGHTAFYRGTGLEELDDPAIILTGGFTLLPARDWNLELAISEDLSVGSSPDIVFQINLRHDF